MREREREILCFHCLCSLTTFSNFIWEYWIFWRIHDSYINIYIYIYMSIGWKVHRLTKKLMECDQMRSIVLLTVHILLPLVLQGLDPIGQMVKEVNNNRYELILFELFSPSPYIWDFSPGVLRNVGYSFIAITPRSTLIRSPIYRSDQLPFVCTQFK